MTKGENKSKSFRLSNTRDRRFLSTPGGGNSSWVNTEAGATPRSRPEGCLRTEAGQWKQPRATDWKQQLRQTRRAPGTGIRWDGGNTYETNRNYLHSSSDIASWQHCWGLRTTGAAAGQKAGQA